MTPELQDALLAMIQGSQDQIPAVLQEVLLRQWMRVYFAWAIFGAFLVGGLATWLVGVSKESRDISACGLICAGFACLLLMLPTWDAFTLTYTPKAVLVDYVLRMLK